MSILVDQMPSISATELIEQLNKLNNYINNRTNPVKYHFLYINVCKTQIWICNIPNLIYIPIYQTPKDTKTTNIKGSVNKSETERNLTCKT